MALGAESGCRKIEQENIIKGVRDKQDEKKKIQRGVCCDAYRGYIGAVLYMGQFYDAGRQVGRYKRRL